MKPLTGTSFGSHGAGVLVYYLPSARFYLCSSTILPFSTLELDTWHQPLRDSWSPNHASHQNWLSWGPLRGWYKQQWWIEPDYLGEFSVLAAPAYAQGPHPPLRAWHWYSLSTSLLRSDSHLYFVSSSSFWSSHVPSCPLLCLGTSESRSSLMVFLTGFHLYPNFWVFVFVFVFNYPTSLDSSPVFKHSKPPRPTAPDKTAEAYLWQPYQPAYTQSREQGICLVPKTTISDPEGEAVQGQSNRFLNWFLSLGFLWVKRWAPKGG